MKLKAKPTITEPRWIKAIVLVKQMEHLTIGLPLGLRLRTKLGAALYFARYTSEPMRLEYQLFTTASPARLRSEILAYRLKKARASKVIFEPCTGSMAHCALFDAVALLVAQGHVKGGARLLVDMFHWGHNMAGFSYLQEAHSCALQAATALTNIQGMQLTPIFCPPEAEKSSS